MAIGQMQVMGKKIPADFVHMPDGVGFIIRRLASGGDGVSNSAPDHGERRSVEEHVGDEVAAALAILLLLGGGDDGRGEQYATKMKILPLQK